MSKGFWTFYLNKYAVVFGGSELQDAPQTDPSSLQASALKHPPRV